MESGRDSSVGVATCRAARRRVVVDLVEMPLGHRCAAGDRRFFRSHLVSRFERFLPVVGVAKMLVFSERSEHVDT